MKRSIPVGLVFLAISSLMFSGTPGLARERPSKLIPKGAQIGVVSLLSPELMHYHAAKDVNGSFLKIQPVGWNVADMLGEAVKPQLEQRGLTLTPLIPTESLERARERCFVNAALADGLPKNCSAPLVEQAAETGVTYLIVMAPGLNNADHAGSSRSEGVTASMRGWGFLTRERAGAKDKPVLYAEVELLLIGITPEGATLRARQWGGGYSLLWQTYNLPPDPKAIPEDELSELQPLYSAMLSKQAKDLMEQVQVAP